MIAVYELSRIELLRDVFVWAYERSCQQYVAVRQQLISPDTFRLRYRAQLSEAVRDRAGRVAVERRSRAACCSRYGSGWRPGSVSGAAVG